MRYVQIQNVVNSPLLKRFHSGCVMRVWICAFFVSIAGGAQEPPTTGQSESVSEVVPGTASLPCLSSAMDSAVAANLLLPANTVVELETLEVVSSRMSKPDDFFKMRVVAPVKFGDTILVPIGTTAVGQVVDARKAGMGGRPGKLILAARYLEMPQGQIKLRSTFGAAGKDNTNASTAITIAFGVLGLAVSGSDMTLPAGSRLSVKTAMEVPIVISH